MRKPFFDRMLAWLIINVGRPFIFVLRPYRVIGRLPEGERLMLCGNHLSGWDPVFLMIGQPRRIVFMAKAELFRHRVLGWVIRHAFDAFPVERGKGDTGAIDHAKEVVDRGQVLGIFPEGSRADGEKLLPFKSGTALIAAAAGATVVPFGIDRPTKHFRRITIRIGEPLTPEELGLVGEKPNLRAATRLLRERVSALSGIPQ